MPHTDPNLESMSPRPSHAAATMLFVALVLALAQAAGQVDTPNEAERLKDLTRAFRKTRHPIEVLAERSAAVKGMAGHDSEAAAEALLDAYCTVEKELEPVEQKRGEYLVKGRRNTILEKRLELDPEQELQEQITAALLALEQPEALQPLLERALIDEGLPWTLRLALAPRESALEPPPLELVARALRDKRDASTLACGLRALAALGERGRSQAALARELLKHGDPGVRSESVRALTALAVPEALEPLIDSLESESGRARLRVTQSLQTLTHQKIGPTADAWRRWLATEGAPYLRGEVALGNSSEPTGQSAQAIEASETAERYYTIPIDGEALVFIIDRSRSMADPLVGGGRRGRGRGRDEPLPEGTETRMQRAKAELSSVLGRLPRAATFNVIAFAGSTLCFSERMMPATEDVVAEAQKFVNELELEEFTGIYDALDLAFRMAGRSHVDAYWPSSVDTVYLLTDGQPMLDRNNADDTDRIRAAVRRWNVLDRVVVNTIAMGEVPLEFMRSLAEENGGQFAHETGTK